MWKRHRPIEPGRAPPRPALAAAALAAALIVNGAVLGLFHRAAPPQRLMAAAAVERALAACQRLADRNDRRACRVAVAERARRNHGVTVAAR